MPIRRQRSPRARNAAGPSSESWTNMKKDVRSWSNGPATILGLGVRGMTPGSLVKTSELGSSLATGIATRSFQEGAPVSSGKGCCWIGYHAKLFLIAKLRLRPQVHRAQYSATNLSSGFPPAQQRQTLPIGESLTLPKYMIATYKECRLLIWGCPNAPMPTRQGY